MKEFIINKQFGSTMIIVPHQDDEILISGGLLYQLQEQGNPVEVVMVTNGDYECEDQTKGKARLRESIRGLEVLGIAREQLTILGYADTGMPEKDSFIGHLFAEKDEKKVYFSSCGSQTYGLEDYPEFHMQRWGTHADYTRSMIKEDIKTVIEEQKPQNIITTSIFDQHGDHAALFRFVTEILDELESEGYRPDLYCGLVHSCDGDEAWPQRDSGTFDCPKKLEETSDYRWEDRIVLALPKALKDRKLKALQEYEIALEPNAIDFLMAFIKDEEIFWKIR
jgi:LmbE family N-acetylglucosaminyl deacetylase